MCLSTQKLAHIVNEKSRGYYKIKGAASAFNFDFRGKTVLDIGSSTGGFTEYALEHGAKKVIAVEKGTNQMKRPLRSDPRVELHEKTDIFDFRLKGAFENVSFKDSCRFPRSETYIPDGVSFKDSCNSCLSENLESRGALATTGANFEASPVTTGASEKATRGSKFSRYPDVIVADISFLSLTKILKYAKINLARSDTDFLVMLKPQFEARSDQLIKGVVKNEKLRREIIKNFELWLKQNGFVIVNKRDNDLKGKTGNRERFYYLTLEK